MQLRIHSIGFARILALVVLLPQEALASGPDSLQASFAASFVEHAAHEGHMVVARRIVNPGVTRESIVQRELQQQVGEPLSLSLLQEDLTRLENLGIFSHVDIVVVEVEASGGVGLEYHLTEMPWIVPYLTLRYNDENGWSVGPALTSLNLAGRHVILSGRALFGGTTTFELKLKWPWIAYDHLSLDLTANQLVRQDEILDFEESSHEVTPWVGSYLGRHGRIAGTVGWFRMHSDTDGRTLSPTNTDNLVRAGLRLGWDSRDSWRDPRSGWQNEFEVMKVGGWLGGEGSYTQTTFDLRRFLKIDARQSVYLGNLTTISTGRVGTEFPAYFLYRMGGSNSIRGYDVKDLGKKLFGKNQMLYTAEYHLSLLSIRPYKILRWSVSLGLQAALFADLGVAWSQNTDFNWQRFKSGYGTGLRLLIPGSEEIRFDVGVSEDGDFVLHLGTWFRWTAQRLRLR